MPAILSTTLPPLESVLLILGFAGLMWLAFLGNRMLARKMSGWNAIAERFPMAETHILGDFPRECGVAGSTSISRGGLNIHLAAEGVCIHPFFARQNPCLIPWSAIRGVSVSDKSLLLTVEYDPAFQFFLPASASTILRDHLSSDLFHKAVSPFDVAKTIIKQGKQPQWISAITGGAVQMAEKEVKKEQQLGKDNQKP